MKDKKIHYAWLILAACCVMQGIGIGIIANCAGIYYSPICQELGFSMGELTFYKTLSGIFSILSLSLAPILFRKMDVRALAFVLILVAGGCNFLMAFGTELWHWYLLGILQGCTLTAFSHFLPVTILNNWFNEKIGFAMGLSCAASGGLGMVMSTQLTRVIEQYGWRASAMLNGAVCVGLAAPFVLLVLRRAPADMGLLPYGGEHKTEAAKAAEGGQQAGRRLLTMSFVMVVVFSICAKSTVGFAQYLPGYGASVASLGAKASLLLTLYMFGNMCFKFFFGYTNDRLGVFRSTLLELGTLMLGLVLLLTHSVTPMLVGAMLYGTCAMLSNVQSPLLVRTLGDKEHFAKAYARMAMIADASHYISITVFGFVYDLTGRYENMLLICIAFVAIETLLACALFLPRRRQAAR